MALTTCVECKGQISSSARACPHCGHPSGDAWGSCPECKASISIEQLSCIECGFPLKPPPKPSAPPPAPKSPGRQHLRRFGGGKGRPVVETAPEPPGALVFAILGLFVP